MPANHLEEDEVVAKRQALAEELMGDEAKKPLKIRGLMCPRMRALDHHVAPLLKEYASQGCPVDAGRNWMAEELEAAVEKGPHASALEPDAIEKIQIEARDKVKQGFAKVYTWDWLKKNLHKHPQLKLSPLAMIPHKSRKYRAILDLSYQLLVAGYLLPSVNDATKDYAPEEAISQVGSVLPRIIEALTRVDASEGPVSMMKVDLTDGFWRVQYYHGNPDIPCPLIPKYGLPWCPVVKGDQILRAQVTMSNISRVVDQPFQFCDSFVIQLDCPSVRHWDVVGTSS